MHHKIERLKQSKGKDYKLLLSIMGEPDLKGEMGPPTKCTYWVYKDIAGWYSFWSKENMIVYIINGKISGQIIHRSIFNGEI